MAFRFNISAGEFFELIRPTVIILSALVSTGVLLSARKRSSIYIALLWSLGVFLFPLIVLPLYWATILIWKPFRDPHRVKWQFRIAAIYAFLLLSVSVIYLRRQDSGVDAHLFRASQAKVNGDSVKAITEYRKALALEDNPHTHKLLGSELYTNAQPEQALNEFRLAEAGGEPDEFLAFSIGSLLLELNRNAEARVEYQRFLNGPACAKEPPDDRCKAAALEMKLPYR